MADTPETSDHTSAQQRIKAVNSGSDPLKPNQPSQLFPFVGYPRQEMPEGLPFRLQDYLELLDWTGRQFRRGKRGSIDEALPPIMERLNLEPDKWLYTAIHFECSFKGFAGTVRSMVESCRRLGYQ